MSEPKPSAGRVAGTVWVLLQGGPQRWDGEVTYVGRTVRTVERYDAATDKVAFYEASDETEWVWVARARRVEDAWERKTALMFLFTGYR